MLNLPPPTPPPPPASEPEPIDALDASDVCGIANGDDQVAETAPTLEAIHDADPPATEKRKRSSYNAIETVEQIHQVQEWLTLGKRPNQIRALCAEHWGLQTRASESRMHEARKQMALDVNAYERKDMAAKMIQNLEMVIEQSLASGMGSNAIGALKLQADLLQLTNRKN